MMWTLGVLLYQQERATGPDDSSCRKLDQFQELGVPKDTADED